MVQNTPGAWTLTRLQAALSAEELATDFHVNRIEQAEPVLQITMRAQGDLNIYLSVAGDQIIVSTLLWPVDEQANVHEFNAFLLKAQKMVPLSNFSITQIEGRDYYELIGELAVDSSLDAIVLELKVLAENALAAASDLREQFSA